MSFGLHGVSFKDSSIVKREALYHELLRRRVRFFSTCNRIEYYGEDLGLGWDYDFSEREDIFRHLLRLACGLESALLGECEIAQQLQLFADNADNSFKNLINEILSQTGALRARFGLYSPYSVADCVSSHVRHNRLPGKCVTIIGSGVVAELLARHFCDKLELAFVSGKNKYRARQLAHKFGGLAYDRKNIHKAVVGADIIICATNSPHYILEKKHLNRGCVIYDLAMPRNVAPELKAYDLDSFACELEELNIPMGDPVKKCAQAIEEIACAYA